MLDTRSGLGAPSAGALGSGKSVTFKATAGLSTPSIAAVALTITAVDPTRSGHLTVYPAQSSRDSISTVNFEAHRDTPNATIMRVPPSAGTVVVYNGSGGTVQVLADRSGYWTGEVPTVAGGYDPVTPFRRLDTRSRGGAPAAAGSTRTVQMAGYGAPAGTAAAAVNLTAVTPTRDGFLTATADPQPPGERTSTVNFQANETRANFVIVPLNSAGAITLYAGTSGTVHELVDVLGYFKGGTATDNGAYVPVDASRVADTRQDSTPIAAGGTRKIAIYANDGSAARTQAVVVTVTAVAPQRGGHLTVWDGTTSLPAVSNSNFVAAQNVASTVIVPINPDGTISVYNGSSGTTDVAVDLQGYTTNTLPSI